MNLLPEIAAAALVAANWNWSLQSARLVLLIMAGNIAELPPWCFSSKAYLVLSFINVALLVAQYATPLAMFFFFPIERALGIAFVGWLAGRILDSVLQATIEEPMLRYLIAAALTLSVSVWLLVA